jgi:two-component system CheB/CheR fusion protein
MLSTITRRKQILFYLAAVIVPILALLLRQVLEREYGVLPHYVLFYPVVLLVAVLGDAWAGLLATTTTALLVIYWVLPPVHQFSIGRVNDAIGLAIFCAMGICVSVVAELYHRKRQRVAAYEKSEAVWEERRKAEEVLREQDATARRLAAIVESSDEAIIAKTLNGVITSWNHGAQRLYGYSEEEVMGRQVSILAPPDRPDELPDILKRLRKGESIEPFETLRKGKDGTVIPVLLKVSPIKDVKGEIVGASSFAHDMTERKRVEQALLRSEKLAATGRLAATIAHEINNPLDAAMNAVYIVSSDPTISPEAKKFLLLADEELRRAAHITRQTLGFYREQNKRQYVALPKVIEEVVTLYARKLQERHIAVDRRFKCGSCTEGCEGCFLINAGELRQIISNLLVNGMDALRDHGTLYIWASRVTSLNGSGHNIHLTIADNGCGIRAENLKRIFEPFFTTKESVGTGLGLWVTQELVRKHNGVIKVRSRKDKGTAFRITFPATALPPAKRT